MKPKLPEFFTIEQQEILTGLMLGDGHLTRHKTKTENSALDILRTSKDKKYLE
jgi:hypothetical protein